VKPVLGFLLLMSLGSQGHAALMPEKYFASCLKDPVMTEIRFLKNTQTSQLASLVTAPLFPKVTLQSIVAPIQGINGGATSYEFDSWGPFWSLNVKIAWPFYFFGSGALIDDAMKTMGFWIKRSSEERERLMLQTLTEGVIQNGFFYIVRRDIRKFLRHLKNKRKTSGVISAEESSYAMLKDLDFQMQKFQGALRNTLNHLCPSQSNRFDDPQNFWGTTFRSWMNQMGKTIEAKWPNASSYVSRSESIIEQHAALKMVQGEHAVISRPKLFIAGIIDTAIAPTRQPIENPYVNDPYNKTDLGAGVGIQWDFDLFPIRQKQLQATLLKEKIFMHTQLQKRKYFELTAIKDGLAARLTEGARNKERLDQAMGEIKWLVKKDDASTLTANDFDQFSKFYKTTHETALQLYKDTVNLYFSLK
jgi:hypothetical protein